MPDTTEIIRALLSKSESERKGMLRVLTQRRSMGRRFFVGKMFTTSSQYVLVVVMLAILSSLT
jgi:hypothetical protein